jgi:2-polyprenyl-3-methyl-5-hydroxy-6-metoxy-1,4-benzoquinol methylase
VEQGVKELRPGIPWADDVLRAAAVLYDAGASTVWLFGSRGGEKTPDRLSDFDLAVEGLPDGTEAVARASRWIRGRVDIVRLEFATPALRWGVNRSRIVVPWVGHRAEASTSPPPLPDSLAGVRTSAVAQLIRDTASRSVIDFGCGYGWLLAQLAADQRFERLTGVDFEYSALIGARRRIARSSGVNRNKRIQVREGLITHRDPAYLGHDAAAAVEVIEHLDAAQLAAFVGVMFDFLRPLRAVLTTPNSEYNVVWLSRRPRGRRHPDHRFEWSRKEFAEWSKKIASSHGYDVGLAMVGSEHAAWGSPTQLAVFDRCE